jgi:broad specificity phosphatase PhoE
MGQILLVRHGQASFGADDYDVLSETGEQQAADLAPLLRDLGEATLVHGSLVRQRRTAEIAAAAASFQGPLATDERWDELDVLSLFAADPPDLPEGAGHAEFQAAFEATTDRWTGGDHDDDYAETWPAFQQRVGAAFEALVEVAAHGHAVVFSSGGPIAAVTTALLGAGPETYRRLLPVITNASVTKVVAGRRGISLVTFNEHAHLSPDRITYR